MNSICTLWFPPPLSTVVWNACLKSFFAHIDAAICIFHALLCLRPAEEDDKTETSLTDTFRSSQAHITKWKINGYRLIILVLIIWWWDRKVRINVYSRSYSISIQAGRERCYINKHVKVMFICNKGTKSYWSMLQAWISLFPKQTKVWYSEWCKKYMKVGSHQLY